METKIVKLGEMAIARNREEVIKTYSLGSCVGLVLVDKVTNICALSHIVLPSCPRESERLPLPCYYADQAVSFMIDSLEKLGVKRRSIISHIFGGSAMKNMDFFRVGQRNVEEVIKGLTQNNISIVDRHVGGHCARTVTVFGIDGSYKLDVTNTLF